MDQLAAFVGGGLFVTLLGFVNDLFRDRRVDKRELTAREAQRAVERNAFQRQTLLELQETLDALPTSYVEAWVYLVNASAGKPDLGSGSLSADLQGRLDTTAIA